MIKTDGFSAAELDRFRHYQGVSYDVLTRAVETLEVGMSELHATVELRRAFHGVGAHNYFHVPVALFGKRTAYPGDFGAFEALPTSRQLREGDTVILDAAPIFDGYMVDTSYAHCLATSEDFSRLDRELPILRTLIQDRANSGASLQKIAWEVDTHIRDRGFENCHRKHIAAVLGHRVMKTESRRLDQWSYKGLSVKQVSWFLARSRFSRGIWRRLTPNWNHSNACNIVKPKGLWAVEPHVASGNIGVKFEEILVIDDNGAQWLDNDLPHHRRWANYDTGPDD